MYGSIESIIYFLTYQKLSEKQEKSESFAIFGLVFSPDTGNQLLSDAISLKLRPN